MGGFLLAPKPYHLTKHQSLDYTLILPVPRIKKKKLSMSSIAIASSSQRLVCSTHQVKKTQKRSQPVKESAKSIGVHPTKKVSIDSTLEFARKIDEKNVESLAPEIHKHDNGGDGVEKIARFMDEKWIKGNWDLNMFVKHGKMDWDALIVAEAKRRNFLELFPEAATNEEPVLFRSSVIPWWAWIMRSHLPEAELLNGRAAMVGFFAAYMVDMLTRLDMVGQSGNFVCKLGLFVTVVSVMLFKRTEDIDVLKKLVDEATFYDKQWQSSWQDYNPTKKD